MVVAGTAGSTAGSTVVETSPSGKGIDGGGDGAASACSKFKRQVFHRALCEAGSANPNIPPSVKSSTGRSEKDIQAGQQTEDIKPLILLEDKSGPENG